MVMRLSKEQQKKNLEIVRRFTVRLPKASIIELEKVMKEKYGFDRNYIAKLKNKIDAEKAQRINRQTLSVELANFEDTIEELCKECWRIIADKNSKNFEVLHAIKVLGYNLKMLFDVKFDAGVFQKKLGELDIKSFNVFVDLVKAEAEYDRRNKPDKNDTKKLPEKSE